MIAALALAAWGAASVSWSQFSAVRLPQAALAVRGEDARARATMANLRLVSNGAKTLDPELKLMAADAVARDPTYAPAVRGVALAKALANDTVGTARMFALAGRVSKRDLPSRLWLIESRVSQGDVAGALQHYDIALRANPASWPMLFPIMIAASADDGLVGPLARLLAGNPYWTVAFLPQFVSQAPSQDNLLSVMTQNIQLGGRPRLGVMQDLISRLGKSGSFDEAYRFYRLAGGKADRVGLRDGNFAAQRRLPPIDWDLSENPDLVATVEPRPDGDPALFFNVGATTDIAVAEQLLALAPGAYDLSGASDLADTGAAPYLVLNCLNAEGRPTNEMGRVAFAGAARGTVTIPAQGCSVQRLAIRTGVSSATEGPRVWVDSIRLTPKTKGEVRQ